MNNFSRKRKCLNEKDTHNLLQRNSVKKLEGKEKEERKYRQVRLPTDEIPQEK